MLFPADQRSLLDTYLALDFLGRQGSKYYVLIIQMQVTRETNQYDILAVEWVVRECQLKPGFSLARIPCVL